MTTTEQLKSAPPTGTYVIDPLHTSVGFVARHLIGSKVRGHFSEFTGTVTIADPLEQSSVVGEASVASVDTGQEQRDAHLRSADFFDSDTYPDITVTVNQARLSGQGVTVSGSLTVRDLTKPLTFDATVSAASDSEISLDAEVPVNRTDFGLTWNQMGMASVHNTITVHAVFTKR